MVKSTVLTRRELYDLVWSKPMKDLAGDFDLSDRGLAKICERHRVPTPGRGYWAKLQARKKVTKTVFREVDDRALNRIEIRSVTLHLPPAAREVLKQAKAKPQKPKATSSPAGKSVQAGASLDLHSAIVRTAKKLRSVKLDTGGAIRAIGNGLCGVEVSADNVERVIAILNAVAHRLDAIDLPLKPSGQAMQVSTGADTAVFTIKEKTRREKHIPTEKELAAEEKRKERQARLWNSPRSWDRDYSSLFGPDYPEFDTVYTGALVFQVEGYSDGVRRTWADGKTQTVESLLDDIVVGLQTLLAVRKAQREENEERSRQWEEQARRRALAQQRSKREEKRIAYLGSILALQDEAHRLNQWLACLNEASEPVPGDNLDRMIRWARQRLKTLEGTLAPENIDRDLQKKELFPEVDELHDPEGEPPEDSHWW